MATATLHDVAVAAGVSDSTASRALRGTGRVSPSTRRRVEDAAHDLRFSLSRTASSLASGRTMRVPMLFIKTVNTWFNASVLEGCRQALAPAGYDVVPTVVDTRERFNAFFDALPGNRNADAIIVCSVRIDPKQRALLEQLTIPAIGLDSSSAAGFNASVRLDAHHAMRQALQLLVSLGHRRIGYVTGADPAGFSFSAQLRRDAFAKEAAALGLDEAETVIYDVSSLEHYRSQDDAAASVAARIASAPNRPTALCAVSDETALQVMGHLRSLGIRVPQDLSVIGFDDSDLAPIAGLTTLHQSPVEMGRRCGQMALALMSGETLGTPHEIMLPTLIARSSTARLT